MSIPQSPSAALHLQWIKKHPSFIPAWEWSACGTESNYFESVQQMYMTFHWTLPDTDVSARKLIIEKGWLQFFVADLRTHQAYEEKLLAVMTQNQIATKSYSYFATINFDVKLSTVPKVLALIEVLHSFKWLQTSTLIFENYGSTGAHHHIHMLITTPAHKDYVRSKIVEKMFAAKNLKKICTSKNFIDVKIAIPYHTKYIKYEKEESKMANCAKDRQWRDENKIEHQYIK